MGGSIGVAVFSALFNHALTTHTNHIDGFVNGTQTIFILAGAICAIACVAATFIIEVPLRAAGDPGAKPPLQDALSQDRASHGSADKVPGQPRGAS